MDRQIAEEMDEHVGGEGQHRVREQLWFTPQHIDNAQAMTKSNTDNCPNESGCLSAI